jgi:sarcosine oxidase subunit beta
MKPIKTADVIVVGGGAMGSSTAYQLSKRGLKVILCEMRTLASGATGRCGGMVVHCYGRDTNIDKTGERLKFTRANTKMLEEFQQELDIDYEFRKVGCLDIASSEEEYDHLKELVSIQKRQGDDTIELLDKQQTFDLMPTLNKELIFGSRWRPDDGNLSPYKMVHAFARGAQKNGAEILIHTPVKKLLVKDSTVYGVEVLEGEIHAPHVVCCTNAWSQYLFEEGKQILPVREVACVTEAIGPVPPMAFEFLLKGEFAYGCTQTKTGNLSVGGPAHPIEKNLGYYNEVVTYNEVRRLAYYLSEIFPKLRDLKLIRSWAGTMAFGPDGLPIIGKSYLVKNLHIAAGFAAGMSQECIVGKILTESVCGDESTVGFDLGIYDPIRFAGKTFVWPEPYDLSILHDYLEAKSKGKDKEYQIPYILE